MPDDSTDGAAEFSTREAAVVQSDEPAPEASDGYQLTLRLSHPNCWMRDVTAATDARLLVNAVYIVDGQVKTHVVAYAESTEALDALVDATKASSHTCSVTEMCSQHDFGSDSALTKKAQRSLLVEYDPEDSIHDALVSRGFMPQDPIRIRDGEEFWTLAVDYPRETIRAKLDEVRQERDAEISVEKITTRSGTESSSIDIDRLSDRQREVFELARDSGYYDSPRRVSGTDMAEELGISKATLHEHLRKVEAKLLGAE